MNMERIFIRLGEISASFPDGFTIELSSFEIVKKGWAVGLKGLQNFSGEFGMVKALEAAFNTSKTISGWRHEEMTFWDVVMIFKDEETATFAGKKMEQMAIYQIETGKIKWLK
jgi:hypothetical protein